MNNEFAAQNPPAGQQDATPAKFVTANPNFHGCAQESKAQLALEFALWKAITVGKGREGKWRPFVESQGLALRTVDRWVAKKLATGQLPHWADERLRRNKKAPPEPGCQPPETTPERGVRFRKARPDGAEILEWPVPFTAGEKAEFVNNVRFLSVEKAKRLFLAALHNAAQVKRGHQPEHQAEQTPAEFVPTNANAPDHLHAANNSLPLARAWPRLKNWP